MKCNKIKKNKNIQKKAKRIGRKEMKCGEWRILRKNMFGF